MLRTAQHSLINKTYRLLIRIGDASIFRQQLSTCWLVPVDGTTAQPCWSSNVDPCIIGSNASPLTHRLLWQLEKAPGSIDDLQSIPRESNDKDVAAMLDELTIEANEESFVVVLQHGGNDVTCKQSILGFLWRHVTTIHVFQHGRPIQNSL